ncbi:hypothetical protein [Arcicella rosea]|uniref:ERCC4 domain-containing protein n=1 Tax=Arcicella rosea TaxID=502909 RepID=A0A841ENX9_9BACT|nr:hypothetical protein [Arcicella rosea]MBB6004945.1 hypothetical protein [Arcicella rosea]
MRLTTNLSEQCVEFNDTRRIAVFKDDKESREFIVNNLRNKSLKKYRVDNCLISEGEKCDYLLVVEDEKLYFIELKGSDLIKAVSQINTSLDKLLSSFSHNAVNGIIVLSKVNTPDLRDTRLIKLSKRLKELNGTLVYGSKKMEEQL